MCLLLVGCLPRNIDFIDPADPALTKKLAITEQDWSTLKQLSAEMRGFVPKDVGRESPDVIAIEFKKPDDHLNDQGGPIVFYEKKDGTWTRQRDSVGDWVVVKAPR